MHNLIIATKHGVKYCFCLINQNYLIYNNKFFYYEITKSTFSYDHIHVYEKHDYVSYQIKEYL